MIAFADSWMDWALRGLVLSTLLLGIAWAMHAAWGRRLSARAAHALALLPLVPLLVPRLTTWQAPSLESATLQSLATRAGFAPTDRPAGPVTETEPRYVSEEAAAESTAIAPELLAAGDSGWPIESLLMVLWAVGAAALALGLVRGLLRTQAVIQAATPLASSDARRIHRLVPATRAVRLLQTDQLASPAAWGWKDRRIVLPEGLAHELDDAQLAWVLRHELAHHTRRDLPLSLLQRVVQIVWWFHPALWWWSQRIELTRECACDEQAARSLSGDRRPAATALLAVAERPRLAPLAALALHSSNDPVRTMKTRLTRLLQPRPSRLAGYATAGLCALLAGGSLLLSQSVWALTPQEPVEVEPPEEIVEEVIEFEEPIVELAEPEEIIEEEPPAETFEFGAAPVGFRAQAWLLNQQRLDGSWPTGQETDEPTGEFTVIGNTALVLLSLEQRHAALPESRWENSVRHGLDYLRGAFDEKEGQFALRADSYRAMPDHLMATYAAYRLHKYAQGEEWDRIRRAAVRSIEEARNPYAGWRFAFVPDGDNDSFITSLALRTLAEAAKVENAEAAQSVVEGGMHFLHAMTDPDSGRVGYQRQGAHDPRFVSKADDYPTKYTELCTSVATLARSAHGKDPLDDPTALRSLTLVAAKQPVWNMTNGSVDYYYWMFGAEAMNLVGGRLAERWHGALRTALGEHQTVAGSWPAIDAWSTAGADVHATACALLAWQAANANQRSGR